MVYGAMGETPTGYPSPDAATKAEQRNETLN